MQDTMMDEVDEGIGSNENSNNSTDGKSLTLTVEDLLLNRDIMLGKDTNGDVIGVKERGGQTSQPCGDGEHISDPGVLGKGVVNVGPTLNGDSDAILRDSNVNGSAVDKEESKDEDIDTGNKINKANLDVSKLPAEEGTIIDLEDDNNTHTETEETNQTDICNSDKTTHIKTNVTGKQFLDNARNSLKLLASKIRSDPDRKPDTDAEHNSEAPNASNGNISERLTVNGTDGAEMLEDDGTVQSPDTENMSAETINNSEGNMKDIPKESVRLKEAENGILNSVNTDEDLLKDDMEDGIPMEIGSDDENQLLNESDEEKASGETDRIVTKELPLQDRIVTKELPLQDDNSKSNNNLGNTNETKTCFNRDVSDTPSAGVENEETKELQTNERKLETIPDEPAEDVAMDGDAENDNLNEINDTKRSDDMKESQNNLVVDNDDDDDDVIFNGESKIDPSSATKTGGDRKSSTVEDKPVNSNDGSNDSVSIDVDDDSDVIFEKEIKVDSKNKELTSTSTTNDLQTTEILSTDNVDESDMKTDVEEKGSKCAENLPGKSKHEDTSCDKKDEPVKEDESSSVNDRKRPADTETSTSTDSKRSRLDLGDLIGKLGSRVEPVELSDSDNDDSATDVAPEKESEISDDDEEEEAAKSKEESGKKGQKIFRLTEEELDAVVREKVKAYLASQHDSLVAQLSQKMKDLGLKNTLWKQQVKDLQVRVNDVTILQCRQEKRKAKAEALRHITTRHVAVQVDDGKTSSSHKQAAALHKPPPSPVGVKPVQLVSSPPAVASSAVTLITSPTANGTIRLPIPQSSLAPPVLTAQAPHNNTQRVPAGYKIPTVKSLLDNTRVQPTIGSSPAPTLGANTPVMVQYQQQPQRFITTQTSQGYIAVQQATAAPPPLTQTVSVPKGVTKPTTTITTVALAAPGTTTKIIDLTDDEDSLKPRLVTLPPGLQAVNPQQLTGVRQVLANSQLVRAARPNNGTAYQLVFNSQSVRPGTMIASATQPGAVYQTVGQNTVVPLASPMVLSPGTSLARAATPLPPPQPMPIRPQHPAPFPTIPSDQRQPGQKDLPPKPSLKISRVEQGIVLSWTMTLSDSHAEVSNYQLFAYQETSALPVFTLWKKVGDVKALPLPMACTLTQFQVGNKYHFAVRAMDNLNRVGMFSDPSSIHLTQKPTNTTNK